MTSDKATVRLAARALLVDEDQRLLLFRGREVGGSRALVWYVPGGAVEPGETIEQAAVRELWEETGVDVAIGPCVWTRRRLRSDGTDSQSRFFFSHVRRFDFDVAAVPVPGEVEEYRWWSLDEIVAAGPELFIPRRLAELLGPLLDGALPRAPLDASD